MAILTLGDLKGSYPDWDFGVRWTTKVSGPDVRQVYAERDGVTLLAADAAGLLLQLTGCSGSPHRPPQVSKKSE